jgi:hypothetical protein
MTYLIILLTNNFLKSLSAKTSKVPSQRSLFIVLLTIFLQTMSFTNVNHMKAFIYNCLPFFLLCENSNIDSSKNIEINI